MTPSWVARSATGVLPCPLCKELEVEEGDVYRSHRQVVRGCLQAIGWFTEEGLRPL